MYRSRIFTLEISISFDNGETKVRMFGHVSRGSETLARPSRRRRAFAIERLSQKDAIGEDETFDLPRVLAVLWAPFSNRRTSSARSASISGVRPAGVVLHVSGAPGPTFCV